MRVRRLVSGDVPSAAGPAAGRALMVAGCAALALVAASALVGSRLHEITEVIIRSTR
jgi:hypothetical protein